MSGTSVISELRMATQGAHAALEALPVMRRLMADDYALDEYGRLLWQFRSLYSSIEPSLLCSAECRAIAYTQRQPRIEAALSALPVDEASAPHDSGCDVPALDTPARRWGCLYVIEGSMLGGQVIQRHLRKVLPGLAAAAYEAMVPYDNPGAQWQKVRASLEDALGDEAQRRQAMASASATFEIFRASFAR